MAAGTDEVRESWALLLALFAHQPTEARGCHRALLRCLGDLLSHTGDIALQQCVYVGGCTWNAIIHSYLAKKPLVGATKYESR